MRSKKEYLDFVVEWLSPLGEITSRSMMGGYILYCGGVVFALLADNTLYLKADDATRPRFKPSGSKLSSRFPISREPWGIILRPRSSSKIPKRWRIGAGPRWKPAGRHRRNANPNPQSAHTAPRHYDG